MEFQAALDGYMFYTGIEKIAILNRHQIKWPKDTRADPVFDVCRWGIGHESAKKHPAVNTYEAYVDSSTFSVN